ncbi:MAG: hypothetical protein K2M43_01755 [Mycoplasmoidaceae bacterium]|nr:hypothetical protein [Mycoplasmoidaceae bacterium]
MIGCDRYATACISDLNNPLDSVFLSDAKQEFTDPNGKNVITEQKVDDVYQDEGCYEYAHIRDSALNYILNGVKPEGFSGELTNQGH